MFIRSLGFCLIATALHAQAPTASEIRSAVERALPVVQTAATGFYKVHECSSCHHHTLPVMTFRMARERGIRVDEAAAAAVAAKGLSKMPDLTSLDRAVQDNMIIDTAASDSWALIAADAAGIARTPVMGVYARRIANWQRADGHFPTGDARPPQSHSDFTATAISVRGIALDLPEPLAREKADRLARAKKWLLTAQPGSTEEYTARLSGLYWAGASPAERAKSVSDLAGLQRPNGGWAQLPHMQPDAYSTGEALVALHDAGGIAVTDARWQKGLRYLLSTQDDHGVWHVRTRMVSPAPVSPPYLETGFPFGHDQFISMDGTCWAAMALMQALPKVSNPVAPQTLSAFSAKDVKPWMQTALFGTSAELKSLLDKGLDANSKTAEGTTLLMMAAHDPEKVSLLLARRADAAAKAKNGYTALMVAATYQGTVEAMKTLLAHGAEAKPGTGVMFNASPLHLASLAGDRENVALLLSKGADPNRKMNMLGMFPNSPLMSTVGYGNPEVLTLLVKGGAQVDEKDGDGLTALHWAVLANRAESVKALIAAKAKLNLVDRFGYTPLLYAASIDLGNAESLKALVQAGADRSIKTKEGKTAQMQAAGVPYLKEALR